MSAELWAVAMTLTCALLVYSTYAAIVGFAGVLSGASYASCPRCHHHYLRLPSRRRHVCPHGPVEQAFQLAWHGMHPQASVHHGPRDGELNGEGGTAARTSAGEPEMARSGLVGVAGRR